MTLPNLFKSSISAFGKKKNSEIYFFKKIYDKTFKTSPSECNTAFICAAIWEKKKFLSL